MIEALYIPPKPAIIISRPREIIHPGAPNFIVPPALAVVGALGINALSGGGGGGAAAPPVSTLISRTAGTPIGNMTGKGGLPAGFDGVTSQDYASGAERSSGNNATIGKDWGSSVTRLLSGVKITAPNANGITDSGSSPITITFKAQGSTDNFSSSIVDLYSSGTYNAKTPSLVIDLSDGMAGFIATTAYRYHRVLTVMSITDRIQFAEVEFYEWL